MQVLGFGELKVILITVTYCLNFSVQWAIRKGVIIKDREGKKR